MPLPTKNEIRNVLYPQKIQTYHRLLSEIQITSPDHSSEWEVGGCYDILWETTLQESFSLQILLKNIDGSTAGTFVSGTPNDGEQNVCVDTGFGAGTYWINIAETVEKDPSASSENFVIKERDKTASIDALISVGTIMMIVLASLIVAAIIYRRLRQKWVETHPPLAHFDSEPFGHTSYSEPDKVEVGIILKGQPPRTTKIVEVDLRKMNIWKEESSVKIFAQQPSLLDVDSEDEEKWQNPAHSSSLQTVHIS